MMYQSKLYTDPKFAEKIKKKVLTWRSNVTDSYQTDKKRRQYEVLMDQIKWCKENLGPEHDRWIYHNKTFEFKNNEDFVLFKLRWL